MLNSPTPVPSPNSAALQEALNLIAGLGSGDKNLKAMLEKMKDVQTNNEKVVKEAVDGITKVNKDYENYRKDVEAFHVEQIKHQEDTRKRQQDFEMERVEFEKQKTTLSDSYRSKDNSYNERHGVLVNKEIELARDQERCLGEASKNESRSKQLDEREAEVVKAEGNLYAIKEYLKAHI